MEYCQCGISQAENKIVSILYRGLCDLYNSYNYVQSCAAVVQIVQKVVQNLQIVQPRNGQIPKAAVIRELYTILYSIVHTVQ